MILAAPCKINLGLDVLRRRGDGFHELRTLFVATSLADEVEVFAHPRGDRDVLSIEGPESQGIVADDSNLVLRAVNALRAEMVAQGHGRDAGWLRIRLVKRIPHGAGLGGGSSDAAAALRAAREIWGATFDDDTLSRLAARIGSDCAFFVRGGAAMASGRGDLLEPIPCKREFAVLIVKPPCSVPTGAAYAGLDPARDFGGRTNFAAVAAWLGGGGSGPPELHNSFTRSVRERHPAVDAVLAALGSTGAECVQMSGSGSACFAIFGSAGEAAAAAEGLVLPAGTLTWVARSGG